MTRSSSRDQVILHKDEENQPNIFKIQMSRTYGHHHVVLKRYIEITAIKKEKKT